MELKTDSSDEFYLVSQANTAANTPTKSVRGPVSRPSNPALVTSSGVTKALRTTSFADKKKPAPQKLEIVKTRKSLPPSRAPPIPIPFPVVPIIYSSATAFGDGGELPLPVSLNVVEGGAGVTASYGSFYGTGAALPGTTQSADIAVGVCSPEIIPVDSQTFAIENSGVYSVVVSGNLTGVNDLTSAAIELVQNGNPTSPAASRYSSFLPTPLPMTTPPSFGFCLSNIIEVAFGDSFQLLVTNNNIAGPSQLLANSLIINVVKIQ